MKNLKSPTAIIILILSAAFLVLTIAAKQWFLLVAGLIVFWGLWKSFSSRASVLSSSNHESSSKQSHESLNQTLDTWKYVWVNKQSKRSALPRAYWEIVADEIITGRMEVLQIERGQNPNTPMGLYADHSEAALQYLVQRNNKAIEREKAGDIDGAMFLYEVSVADAFLGSHPYDRLRILYIRAKQYNEALRICHDYMALPDRPHGQNKSHFAEWIDKLEKKRIQV